MNNLITKFDDVDTIFNHLWRSGLPMSRRTDDDSEVVVRPRVDVYETDSEFVIEAELPGVAKDDLNVEIERDVLTISGKRERKEEKDLHGVHLERSVNARFARRFALGKELEADKIEGKLEDGVLRLTVPKKEKALPRRIHVG
jgi:HSP20 family protein